jgi:uncharacterized membrane protein YeaQ/YmgE (transglycosylase-associated protein family)
MLVLLWWLLFGLIVGSIAKMVHPGSESVGFIVTVLIGVIGSFIGGGINWLLSMGDQPFEASGFLMSILGGVICCVAWRYYNLRLSGSEPKSFFTGRNLK